MTKQWSQTFVLLVIVVLTALFVRLISIDTAPYGAHIDEASLGYNAFSVAQTGKDEYGKTLPLIFQAYGDQKLPAYIYSIAPLTYFFGLSNLAVRLPGAIAGSLFVVFVYLLLKQLKFSDGVSLLGALVAATSPWGIMLSRVFGYESGFGLLFFTIGVWSFLEARNSRHAWKLIVMSAIAFALTWYSYIAYRVITPIMIFILVAMFMRSGKFITRQAMLFLLIFFISIAPLMVLSRSGTGTARIGQAVHASMQGVVMTIDDDRSICAKSLPRFLCYINSNKIKSYAMTMLNGYAEVFAPPYLFVKGDVDDEYVNVAGYGLLSFAVLPWYLLGCIYLGSRLITRSVNRFEVFVILGLLITPLPTLIFGVLQKVRLSGLFPFIIITCMYGIQYFLGMIRITWQRRFILLLSGVIILLSTGFFMVDFLAIHVQKYEITFQTPIAKLMKYLGAQDKNLPTYVRSINEAVVLYAYYNAVDPAYFQNNVTRPPADSGGFSHATDLGNLHRTDMNIDEIYCKSLNAPHFLYATNADLMKEGLVEKPKHIIYSRDKVHELYYIYDSGDIITKGIDCEYLTRDNP